MNPFCRKGWIGRVLPGIPHGPTGYTAEPFIHAHDACTHEASQRANMYCDNPPPPARVYCGNPLDFCCPQAFPNLASTPPMPPREPLLSTRELKRHTTRAVCACWWAQRLTLTCQPCRPAQPAHQQSAVSRSSSNPSFLSHTRARILSCPSFPGRPRCELLSHPRRLPAPITISCQQQHLETILPTTYNTPGTPTTCFKPRSITSFIHRPTASVYLNIR